MLSRGYHRGIRVKSTPYLAFHGNAHDSLEFYKSVFSGRLEIQTYVGSSRAGEVISAWWLTSVVLALTSQSRIASVRQRRRPKVDEGRGIAPFIKATQNDNLSEPSASGEPTAELCEAPAGGADGVEGNDAEMSSMVSSFFLAALLGGGFFAPCAYVGGSAENGGFRGGHHVAQSVRGRRC